MGYKTLIKIDSTTTEEDKKKFKSELRQLLVKLSEKYRQKVSESEHIENIDRLAREISDKCSDVLKNGRFRIGSAQKALNSYLKYLWCTDKISRPPHCPFDSVIIYELEGCKEIKWTELDDISKYKQLVDAARKKALESGIDSLAEWELRKWNNYARRWWDNQVKLEAKQSRPA